MNCPLLLPKCDGCDFSKQGSCDYPYKKGMTMAEIKDTTKKMVHWKFKCLKYGYRFRAIQPKELYDAYNECAICGSKEFEKRITR